MPLEVRENDLPGVGKKYEIDLDEHLSVAVLIHTDGKRELFYRDDRESEDFTELLELSDSQARILGLFLVGAYYQPIATELNQQSESGEYIDWYSVEEDSPLVGIDRSGLDSEPAFDGILLGVDRDGEIHSTVPDDFTFVVGDQLIVIGSDGVHDAFSAFVYPDTA